MLSRVAESILWMNRYLERAENYARFIDVNFNLSLEHRPKVTTQWKPLVSATGDGELYAQLYPEVEKSSVIRFLGFDERNPNSIYSSITNARENARAIRPEITKEIWEQINTLYHFVREATAAERWKDTDPRAFFFEIKQGCQLVWGLYESTITKNDGWHFSRIGRLVERADKTSRILDIKYLTLLPKSVSVGSNFDLVQWTALLKSISAFDMYKKQYGKLTSMGIIEFMIFDKRFPRSIFSCLLGVEDSLTVLADPNSDRLNPVQRKLGLIKSQLEYSDINEIIQGGLHEYLDGLQSDLNQLSATLFDTFFSVDAHLNGATGGTMTQSQSQS